MRPPRAVTSLVLLLSLLQNTGCRSFMPLGRELPADPATAPEEPTVRVYTTNGQEIDLTFASQDSLAIHGKAAEWGGWEEIQIPLSEVVRVEEKRRNWSKTGLITVATVAVLAVTIHLVAQNNSHFLNLSGG